MLDKSCAFMQPTLVSVAGGSSLLRAPLLHPRMWEGTTYLCAGCQVFSLLWGHRLQGILWAFLTRVL